MIGVGLGRHQCLDALAVGDSALAERRETRVVIDEAGVSGQRCAIGRGEHGALLGEVLQRDLGAQLVELQAFHQVGGLEQGRVEEEAAAILRRQREDEEIADHLALRRQQCAVAGLSGHDRIEIVGHEVLQEVARVVAADADDAAIDQSCGGHGLPFQF